MKIHLEWGKPFALRDAAAVNMIYDIDLSRIPKRSGVYAFGRTWGGEFEALYVGQATELRGRIKSQLNNLRLMQHLRNAKNGRRVVLAGELRTKPGQNLKSCLDLAERALIRHFLSEAHDLVNKQGTRLSRHEINSSGRYPKKYFPRQIHLDRP